jgi:hypothetical protein
VRLGDTGEGPFEDPECGRPLDLSALRGDNALSYAPGVGRVRPDVPYEGCAESDRELVAMLAAWVAEVRPEGSEPLSHADPEPALTGQRPRPLTAVPDQPAAEPATVEPATPRPAVAGPAAANRTGAVARPPVPPSERRGLLAQFGRRLAVAALLAGLASSGLAVGMGSEPNGTSMAVSRVAYADKARSAAAVVQVTDELHVARTALEEGHRAEAARAITSIGQHLPAVRDDDGRARLERDHQRLRQILAASGGPPAANDIVLAAVAPEVEPSDFLGNLADRNDRLGADTPPPAAPAPAAVPAPVPGQNGPSAVILADGPPPATEGPTAGSGAGASAGSPTTTASAPTSVDDPATGPAAAGSSASESSNNSSVPETSGTSAPDTSSPESSSPESSSPESSTSEKTTTTTTTTTTKETTTTKKSTTTKETTESSTTRKTSAPETSAPKTTAVPKPPSSATRTTEPEDETSSASSPRSASPLPSSQDFIGPVADRPSATGRKTTSRTSTSRTSTSDASSEADSSN